MANIPTAKPTGKQSSKGWTAEGRPVGRITVTQKQGKWVVRGSTKDRTLVEKKFEHKAAAQNFATKLHSEFKSRGYAPKVVRA